MMTTGYRWTFLFLGFLLALFFVAGGIMLAVLLEGWQRAGGVPPVYMGWIIFRYCREKYGKNSAQKNKKNSNTTSEPIVANRAEGSR
jgi:hypothetical protein